MKYRIGLIGCGGIAGTWVQAVAQHPDCHIALTYDLSPQAAAQRAAEAGGRAVKDLEELFGSDQIDMVIVATPTPSHPDLVIRAAQAGKHALCEKPMALSLKECRRMGAACQRAGVKLAVGHSLRFWGAFLACRRLVAEGAIGAPVSGSIDRIWAARLHPVAEAGKDETWRAQTRNTGGAVLEGFVHEMDFTRAVFGEVAAVDCQIAGDQEYAGLLSPQIVQALVRFESGALVTLRTGGTVALPSMGYWLAGTEGALRFTAWGGPLEHYRHDFPEKKLVECEKTSAYYLELCDLIRAIEEGGEPENSPANGEKNVGLGLAMYRAFETGRRVAFAEGIPLRLPATYQNTQW
ncbi:MAG: Gfo/Idh/MocA family oxidoreductase [Candidatus Handelsmanbacteria bacterium]|nr:Gfo/Idh/MocA family oxidoreductase [Candidatus Handelsmanbacteria bacterium]